MLTTSGVGILLHLTKRKMHI